MPEPLTLTLNGRERSMAVLSSPTPLEEVLRSLELRPDRIAVELNGELAPRTTWAQLTVRTGDRLEIVHFVGGGS